MKYQILMNGHDAAVQMVHMLLEDQMLLNIKV